MSLKHIMFYNAMVYLLITAYVHWIQCIYTDCNVTWHQFILANTDIKVNNFVTFVGYMYTNHTTQ